MGKFTYIRRKRPIDIRPIKEKYRHLRKYRANILNYRTEDMVRGIYRTSRIGELYPIYRNKRFLSESLTKKIRESIMLEELMFRILKKLFLEEFDEAHDYYKMGIEANLFRHGINRKKGAVVAKTMLYYFVKEGDEEIATRFGIELQELGIIEEFIKADDEKRFVYQNPFDLTIPMNRFYHEHSFFKLFELLKYGRTRREFFLRNKKKQYTMKTTIHYEPRRVQCYKEAIEKRKKRRISPNTILKILTKATEGAVVYEIVESHEDKILYLFPNLYSEIIKKLFRHFMLKSKYQIENEYKYLTLVLFLANLEINREALHKQMEDLIHERLKKCVIKSSYIHVVYILDQARYLINLLIDNFIIQGDKENILKSFELMYDFTTWNHEYVVESYFEIFEFHKEAIQPKVMIELNRNFEEAFVMLEKYMKSSDHIEFHQQYQKYYTRAVYLGITYGKFTQQQKKLLKKKYMALYDEISDKYIDFKENYYALQYLAIVFWLSEKKDDIGKIYRELQLLIIAKNMLFEKFPFTFEITHKFSFDKVFENYLEIDKVLEMHYKFDFLTYGDDIKYIKYVPVFTPGPISRYNRMRKKSSKIELSFDIEVNRGLQSLLQ